MKKLLPLFLLGWLLMLYSCKQDDFEPETFEEHSPGFKKSIVSFHEMKSELSHNSGNALALFTNTAGKGGDDDYIRSIDSTYIVQFSNDTLTTYTMKVSTLDDGNYSFSNLVIKVENGQTEETVIHYSPTQEWQDDYDNGERTAYSGDIKMVDTQGNSKTGGTYICTFSAEPIYQCSNGWMHAPGTPGCQAPSYYIIGYNVIITCSFMPTGGGSGGGSGGGTGGPNDDPTEPGGGLPTDPVTGQGQTPCQVLKSKLLLDSWFPQKLKELKDSLHLDHEVGYANNNENQYEKMVPVEREDGTFGVDLENVSVEILGFMHSHFITPINMGVHSVADIRAFMNLLRRRNGMNDPATYPVENAYCIVVGEHGIYALMLEDFAKFNNWQLQYGYNQQDGKKYAKYFEDMEKEYKEINKHPNTRLDNERAILELLDQYYNDLGVGIYRRSDERLGWDRMSFDENREPQFTPCN